VLGEPVALTTAEAAALLGVSPSTIRRLKRSGALPFVQLGRGSIRYRREDLESLCRASLRSHATPIRPRRATTTTGAGPVWLDPGRMNPVTGRPFGSIAR
jgi:excisionase family DNA binding protein